LHDSPGNATGQLWLLEDGPGSPGSQLWNIAEGIYIRLNRSFDIYVPDHRGTGFSERLDDKCDDKFGPLQYNYTQCLEHILSYYGVQKLKTFSTTNAALDVINVINNVSQPTDNIYIYALSYGTYLAQRILFFEKNLLNPLRAVILDSVCIYGLCDFLTFDYNIDQSGKKLLVLCENDTFCSNKISKVTSKLSTLYSYLNKSTENYGCANLLTKYKITTTNYLKFQYTLGLFISGDPLREMLAPLLRRFDRCSSDDITELEVFFKYFNFSSMLNDQPSKNYTTGTILASNIIIAEILAKSPYLFSFPNMPTKDEYLNYQKKLQFISIPGVEQQIVAASIWPNYTSSDNNIGHLANDTNTTILFLNGNMDTETPLEYAQYAYGFYTNKTTKRLIPFNGYRDAILTYDCGMNVIISFLQNGGDLNAINITCAQNLTIRFYANSTLAKYSSKLIFGTDNAWGDRDNSHSPNSPMNPVVVYIISGILCALVSFGVIYYLIKRKSVNEEEKRLLITNN